MGALEGVMSSCVTRVTLISGLVIVISNDNFVSFLELELDSVSSYFFRSSVDFQLS